MSNKQQPVNEFDALENSTEWKEISREYFAFKEKGAYYFKLTGLSTMEKDGKTIEVVELENKAGDLLLNGDKVLVTSCKKLNPPVFIKVVYLEDRTTAQGTYKNLEVHAFAGDIKK